VIDLKQEDGICVLRMDSGENRFNPELLEAFEAALDEVEASKDATALVTTGEGKFYSNGLDLEWLMGPGGRDAEAFVSRVQRLFARLLTLSVPTVAAINGHAFGAGAMLAMAHDLRVMREERGYWCIPEVDLATARPLSRGMASLLDLKLPIETYHACVLTARRYPGIEALPAGIVDRCASKDELLGVARAMALERAGKHRPTVAVLKQRIFEPVIAALNETHPFSD
jgi:enoyl-CoA hydratase/carnithine racemase